MFKTLLVATVLSTSAISANAATLEYWDMGTGAGAAGRSDPNSVGDTADGSFLSLGLGGTAVFSFGASFTGPINIVETTWGNTKTYKESASIWAATSFDGSTLSGFVKLADITNGQAQGAGATLLANGLYKYLAVVDTTGITRSDDGFDIDAISVSLLSVPLTASAGLLVGALGGLGFLRRRRKAA